MSAITTRFRSLWLLGVGLTLAAGVVAFIIETQIRPDRPCRTGSPSHGLRYFVIFLALAVLPVVVVGITGWRSRRDGADAVGPFVATTCLAVIFVFSGLLVAWNGHGCIT
jgi:cytochrome bd-type quinol oxidase subunit 2